MIYEKVLVIYLVIFWSSVLQHDMAFPIELTVRRFALQLARERGDNLSVLGADEIFKQSILL